MAILVSQSDNIATITLDRPEKRNALDNVIVHDLVTALKKLALDKKVGVLIIKANGDHFCAGADISWMQKIAQSTTEENQQDALQLAMLMHSIHTFPKPVIVLTQGTTLGGGLGIVAACDIAIAAENASFSFSEVKIGIAPSVVSPYVIAAMGERAARYYFLTAEKFDAYEARRIGFIHQIVDLGALNNKGMSLANELLKHSPAALAETKKLVSRVAREKMSDHLIQFTAEHLATVRTQPDAKEGLKAFLEKRLPTWR